MQRYMGALAAAVVLTTGCQRAITTAVGRADEAAAVAAIEKLGGFVRRDEQQSDKPVTLVSIRETTLTDAGLKELVRDLQHLQQLQALDFGYTKVTDVGLKELNGFKQLKRLELTHTNVTDAGQKELKELKQLQGLFLGGTNVTGTGLEELKELKQLQTLNLGESNVTDVGLKEVN
jgi:Leucine-rich repeat (LRR) protein